MNTQIHRAGAHGGNGSWQFLVILFLAIPALLTLLCSIWLAHASQLASSGVWFVYEASRDLAYMGIAFAAGITAVATVRRTVSETIAILMASATLSAIILLWSAAGIFQGGR